jgi:hypothetical protein
MRNLFLSFLFLNASLMLTGAQCADLAATDTGSADVTIVRGEEEPVRLVHDPLLSQVALSPPAEGFMQLTFTYQDPLVYITLDVNGNALEEGQQVDIPLTELTNEDANIDVEWESVQYSSALDNAEGYLSYEVLYHDDNNGEVRVSFDVLLHPTTATDEEPINISGFVEGVAGDPVNL